MSARTPLIPPKRRLILTRAAKPSSVPGRTQMTGSSGVANPEAQSVRSQFLANLSLALTLNCVGYNRTR